MHTSEPNGTMAKTTNTGTMAITGASVKRNLLALAGTKSSFMIIFSASAMKCMMPHSLRPPMAARLGPMRSCMAADCLRSAQVKSDAIGITTNRISSTSLMSAWNQGSSAQAPHECDASHGRSAPRTPTITTESAVKATMGIRMMRTRPIFI